MPASAAPSRARSTAPVPAAPRDREVEHVDAVLDGVVDRGHQVGRRAAVVGGVGGAPARLVDASRASGRGPGVAAGQPVEAGGDAGVADGDRGDLGAVAADVAGRERPRPTRQSVATEAVDEPARADQLGAAGVGVPALAGHAGAREAGRTSPGAGDGGEERALGPDAGVDDADDDAAPTLPARHDGTRGEGDPVAASGRTVFSSTSGDLRQGLQVGGLVRASGRRRRRSARWSTGRRARRRRPARARRPAARAARRRTGVARHRAVVAGRAGAVEGHHVEPGRVSGVVGVRAAGRRVGAGEREHGGAEHGTAPTASRRTTVTTCPTRLRNRQCPPNCQVRARERARTGPAGRAAYAGGCPTPPVSDSTSTSP